MRARMPERNCLEGILSWRMAALGRWLLLAGACCQVFVSDKDQLWEKAIGRKLDWSRAFTAGLFGR
jgi:hypothetical protein